MENKLLITGITGKSGMALLDELIQNEHRIMRQWKFLIFSIHSEEKANVIRNLLKDLQIGYKILIGDLENYCYCLDICNDIDTIIHIAGIQISTKIMEACVKKNVNRAIMVHTTGIYSKYKLAGQAYRKIDLYVIELAKKNNIELTILRPTMIYGSMDDQNIAFFIKMVDKMKIIPMVNGGHYALQPVNYKDLGKAYYNVLVNPSICNGKNYVLSGKDEIDLKNIFELISYYLGKKRIYIFVPFGIAYVGAWLLYIITIRKFDYREKVQRLCEPRVYDHVEASRDFKYAPMSFEKGLRREIKEYILDKETAVR